MAFSRHKRRYLAYLKSPEWFEKRQQALAQANGRCQTCNASHGLQVHHRTYSNLFDEPLEDLTVLCSQCHQKFHDLLPDPPVHPQRLTDDDDVASVELVRRVTTMGRSKKNRKPAQKLAHRLVARDDWPPTGSGIQFFKDYLRQIGCSESEMCALTALWSIALTKSNHKRGVYAKIANAELRIENLKKML